MKNKILLTTSILSCIAPTLFAAPSNIVGGFNNQVTANNVLAVGMNNKATANEAFVGGQLSEVTGEGAIAYGYANKSTSLNSVALGNFTKATSDFATATGYMTEASGGWSFAAGNQSVASNNGAVAFGHKNQAIGLHSFTAGDSNIVFGTNATTFGNGNTVDGVSSFAVGQKNTTSANFATVVGEENTASGKASFAGGIKSTASGKTAFAFGYGAKSTEEGNIAMGTLSEATGENSTAIGSKVKATGTRTVAIGFNSKASANNAMAIGTNSVARKDNSIAIGIGNQAYGKQSTVIGFGAYVGGDYSTVVGNMNTVGGTISHAFGNENNVSGDASAAIGCSNDVKNDRTFVMGNGIKTTQDNSVILGDRSADRVATTEEEAVINGLKYGNFAGKGSASKGVMSVGFIGGERQIINVAAGKVSSDSTDAVNGSQLYAVAQNVSNVANSTKDVIGGNTTVDQNGNITTNNIGGTGESTIDAAIKKVNAKTTGVEAISNNVTITSKTNATGDKTYTVDINKDLKLNSVTTGDTKIDNKGLSVAGKTYVSKDGLNANNQKVTNVANGKIVAGSKDAVNGGQLHQVDQKIKALAGGIGELGYIVNEHDISIKNNMTLANNAMSEAKKHTSVSAGNNVTVTTNTNVAGGTDYKVSVDKIKFDNVSLDNKGLNNGDNKITGVADGKIEANSKDAINGGQLNNVVNNINNHYNSLNNHVVKLDQRVNKVGAASAALAALHQQDFNPNDKFSAAVGFGNYRDANSVAIGAFYRPNENTLLSIGTTFGSEKMFNAGVSLKFGHHDKMNADTKVAIAKEVQDLNRKYEDLSQKYENLVKLLEQKEAANFKSDLSKVEENMQYKISRVDESHTEDERIERIKATRK